MSMGENVTVYQVSIKKAGGFNLVGVREFTAMPLTERLALMTQGKVQFLDANGEILPLLAAVKSLTHREYRPGAMTF